MSADVDAQSEDGREAGCKIEFHARETSRATEAIKGIGGKPVKSCLTAKRRWILARHALELGDFARERAVVQLVVTREFQRGFDVSGDRKQHGGKLNGSRGKIRREETIGYIGRIWGAAPGARTSGRFTVRTHRDETTDLRTPASRSGINAALRSVCFLPGELDQPDDLAEGRCVTLDRHGSNRRLAPGGLGSSAFGGGFHFKSKRARVLLECNLHIHRLRFVGISSK